MTDCLDEGKFADLLDIAGRETAVELVQRLDEDLTNVGVALANAVEGATLNAQSHILMAIAGTIGATRVFDLARNLNLMVNMTEPKGLASLLAEMRFALNDLIQRVRMIRFDQAKPL